jgi:hypothetical protein
VAGWGYNGYGQATAPAGLTNVVAIAAGNGHSLVMACEHLDTVGDGIANWWRQQYFSGDGLTTNSQSCASCDPDGDGMSNSSGISRRHRPDQPSKRPAHHCGYPHRK